MKIYFDTNVYLDFLEDRSDSLKPLGELAHQAFLRGLDCEYFIVISDLVIEELRKRVSAEDI